MSLIIAMRNISDLAEESDYEVIVWINETPIAGPFVVKGHQRSNGWEALVKLFAKDLKEKPPVGHVPSRR